MSVASPRAFGDYVLLRKLGEGGMGTVYCAEDRRVPGRLVAVKLITDFSVGSEGDESTLRFLRESKILESLRHPNIVTLFETGVAFGERYVAMELLEGRTLAAYVGLPWPRTVPLLVQVCHGMEYLASKGIVHRDLSPENVFVVAEGSRKVAKILDFGIAKDTTAKETIHDFTRTGVLMGKPPYWSPEQIELESGETLDWQSDLYTLGVIFFRVLSGDLPFRADTPVEYIPLHLFQPPPALAAPAGLPPLPPALTGVVRQMLSKRKEDRPRSYAEVVAVLESALREAPPAPEAAEEASAGGALLTNPTAPWETEATRALEGRTLVDGPVPTVAMGMPTLAEESAATVVTRRPGAPRGGRRLAVAASAALLSAVAVGTFLAWPRGGAPEGANVSASPAVTSAPEPAPPSPVATAAAEGIAPSPSPPPGGPVEAEGTVALDAVPWGRLVSITDAGTGRALPLPGEAATPFRLGLPAGRYRLELAREGTAASRTSVVVTVAPGATRTVVVSLAGNADAAALLD